MITAKMKRTREIDFVDPCNEKRQRVSSPQQTPRQFQEEPMSARKLASSNAPKVSVFGDKLTRSGIDKYDHLDNIVYENEPVFMANVMLQSLRYEDALVTLKVFVATRLEKLGTDATVPKEEEILLLLTSFRYVSDKKVASWKSLDRLFRSEPKGSPNADKIRNYIKKIESEIAVLCSEAIHLGTHLISLSPQTIPTPCRLLAYKIQADHMRCLLKINPDEAKRLEYTSKIHELYKTALPLAEEKLPLCHHLSLQLALDLSTFYFKVLNQNKTAYEVASKAFDGAIKVMNDAMRCIDKYSESIVVLQRIRDLITLLKAT